MQRMSSDQAWGKPVETSACHSMDLHAKGCCARPEVPTANITQNMQVGRYTSLARTKH